MAMRDFGALLSARKGSFVCARPSFAGPLALRDGTEQVQQRVNLIRQPFCGSS